MAVFGWNGIGTNVTDNRDDIRAGVYTCPAAGVATDMRAYLNVAANRANKMAIYDNAGNLVAGTNEVVVTAAGTPGWITFTFGANPNITAVEYWLTVWSDNSGETNLYYTPGQAGESNRWQQAVGYNGWPDPWAPATANEIKVSVYCTYTPTAAGVPGNVGARVAAMVFKRHDKIFLPEYIPAFDRRLLARR